MSSLRRSAAIILSVACAANPAAADPSLKERFLAGYSESAQRVENFYRNIEIIEETSGKNTINLYGGPLTFHFRSAGAKYRDDWISQYGVITGSKVSRGDANCRIRASDRNTNTRQANISGKQKYSITEIHEGKNDRLLNLARTATPRLAFAAYSTYDQTVLDVVKSKEIEVTAFDETPSGRAILKYKNHREGGAIWHDELEFDTTRCWVLVRDQKPKRRTVVEYGESVDGIPLVSKLTNWQGGDFQTPAYVSVVKEIKPGPVPDGVFTLAEFGLPELPRPKRPGFPIFTVLGLSGLVVAYVLARVIRRRAGPSHLNCNPW